jgi:hypothetical protein
MLWLSLVLPVLTELLWIWEFSAKSPSILIDGLFAGGLLKRAGSLILLLETDFCQFPIAVCYF